MRWQKDSEYDMPRAGSRKWKYKYEHKHKDRDQYMRRSQMFQKVEYGLPAKIRRLVGCTKIISWFGNYCRMMNWPFDTRGNLLRHIRLIMKYKGCLELLWHICLFSKGPTKRGPRTSLHPTSYTSGDVPTGRPGEFFSLPFLVKWIWLTHMMHIIHLEAFLN